ncbi:MAG: ABC transporter permease, partial [Gemmatimonadetes bacterium]|nr:ABC transporter permease [Gemmatimonadota bacterium]
MFRNYLLTALRNARRNKGVASINVFGLAASMAVCLLIVQIIRIQDSYEEFHEHGTRIYRVYSMFHNPVNAEPHLYGTSPARLAEYADEDLPGIESAIHVRTAFRGMALGDREPLYLRGMYADPDFFDMFSFALAEGNPATALSGPGKIVLSTETARRLFGTSDAVGRTVHLEDGTDLEITGIWAEAAYRTHIPISAVASMETLRQRNDPVFDRWPRGLARSFTFLRLSPGADRAQIEGQLNDLARNRFPDIGATTLEQLYIEPIGDMHLSSVSKDNDLNVNDSTILWFIGSLGIVVMAMAAFNYWSLTVARALRRSKEVGVRKTTGASRQALVAQFMVEALVSVAVAAAVAVGL